MSLPGSSGMIALKALKAVELLTLIRAIFTESDRQPLVTESTINFVLEVDYTLGLTLLNLDYSRDIA